LEVEVVDFAQVSPLADTWGMHGDFGGWWMLLMMIPMLLFWAAIVFGLIWLVRGSPWSRATEADRTVTKETPVEILERRFAEGAITLEDYRARREVLVNGARREPAAAPKQS
jgi:putative membrane protein